MSFLVLWIDLTLFMTIDICLNLLTLSRIFVGHLTFTSHPSSVPIAPLINPLDLIAKQFATFAIRPCRFDKFLLLRV